MMKALALATLVTTSIAFAQGPPIPGGGGGGGTNNLPPYVHTPRPVINGLIHTETLDVIEWYNFDNHLFTVEHRQTLGDGSWATIGEGFDDYVHNNPEGFYRVLRSATDVVFPVWNSGTTNMIWTATCSSPHVTIECLNTNIPPEWGEGFIIARTFMLETNVVIDVYAGTQHQQVMIVVGVESEPWVPSPPIEVVEECHTCVTHLGLPDHDPSLTRKDMPDYQPQWNPPYIFSEQMTNENGNTYHLLLGGVEDEGYANALIGHGWIVTPVAN
jgi:hypothetical protein